jgi:hypothetical protein
MKFHIDINTRRFVRSAAAAIPLETLFFKRRDAFEVEVVFVDRSGIVPTPAGTSFLAGIKSSFGGDFLALTDAAGVLNLHTTGVEALFAAEPEKVSAYFEIKSTTIGEETRTHTLQIDLQNAVILGDEGLPTSSPSFKATQAEAEAGTDNEKWMTPLRTAQAFDALMAASTFIHAFDQSPDGLTVYSGRLVSADLPAPPALPETATTWTIRRSTLNAAGSVLATASAVGSWLNRQTLSYQ